MPRLLRMLKELEPDGLEPDELEPAELERFLRTAEDMGRPENGW
jgi:hypothetical protein